MNWFSQVKSSPHYDRLRHSLEFRYIRRQVLVLGSCCLLILLVALIAGIPDGKSSAKSAVAFATGILVLLPVTAYYIYRLFALFSKIDRYIFTEAVLDRPHMGYRSEAHFTVTLRDRSGRELQRDTSNLFGSFYEPVFDDCVNRKALIGYNDETDTVAVIQILPQ